MYASDAVGRWSQVTECARIDQRGHEFLESHAIHARKSPKHSGVRRSDTAILIGVNAGTIES